MGELACGIVCSCLPTLRPLVAKIKPAWMTSYATRRTRQRYGGESGKGGQYGSGAFGHTGHTGGDASKAVSGNRSRSTRDSIMTASTLNKNYTKLKDQDGASVLVEPMPPSPAYRMGRKGWSDATAEEEEEDAMPVLGVADDGLRYGEGREGVPMQQLQPRPKQQQQQPPQPGLMNDKAMEVLGMGLSGTGVSTEVTGGRTSISSSHPGGAARLKNGSLTGIEVKRSVVVTTSDVDEERFAR